MIANGVLVLVVSLATLLVDDTFAWGIVLMGGSLIFSGSTGFCGFAVIFARLERFRGKSKAP
ncbi:hypothetical protein RMSM_05582 [Rhodopirellula maiorica SM1]|uniref:DUF2892 domain-containing protein n=1 Tax=Rhodopirellula maiorica SM1 TaxID=1265738 RepID=M5RU33_9BACT|nr:hypothetical protein RMSM_05582 [Rhodopirellula maiorica SM1]